MCGGVCLLLSIVAFVKICGGVCLLLSIVAFVKICVVRCACLLQLETYCCARTMHTMSWGMWSSIPGFFFSKEEPGYKARPNGDIWNWECHCNGNYTPASAWNSLCWHKDKATQLEMLIMHSIGATIIFCINHGGIDLCKSQKKITYL